MALLATYPLMTISTMQATRGKREPEAGAASSNVPTSPAPARLGGDGGAVVVPQLRRGAFADILEAKAALALLVCFL